MRKHTLQKSFGETRLTIDTTSRSIDRASHTIDATPLSIDAVSPSIGAMPLSIDVTPLSIDATSHTLDMKPLSIDAMSLSIDVKPLLIDAMRPLWSLRERSAPLAENIFERLTRFQHRFWLTIGPADIPRGCDSTRSSIRSIPAVCVGGADVKNASGHSHA